MKTDNEIEQLLMNGKKLSLSSHEKASIKSALLEHASQSLKHEKLSIPSPWTSWVLRGSVSFASLLIMFVGTAYASQDSLPGEPLYAMKVHVVEEMIALTKIEPSERVAYDISLMETRLAELQTLASQNVTPAQEDLAILTSQIEEHVANLTTTLETTVISEMPHEEKLEALSKLSGIAKAQTKITKDDKDLSVISETVQDTQESTSVSLNSAVKDFANDQPVESVNEYLSDQITVVGEQINASTTNEDARDFAEQHLHDVDESLMDGNMTDALISVLEAQQEIDADKYVTESTNNHGDTSEINSASN